MSQVRRRTVLVGSAALVVGAVATAAAGFGGQGTARTGSDTNPPPSTAPVTRITLTQSQQVNGTLGYGTPVTVNAHGENIITWLPALGATVDRGQPLYRADNHAVPLFYGDLPLYRQLRSGDTGDDVKEIEQNLAALGYAGLTVDTKYTSATVTAVRKWQKTLGLTQTGVFDPAAVVIAPGTVRIASLIAHPTDQAAGPVLTYTATTRIVSVALDVTLQELVKPGLAATVTLPNGKTVAGTIATVGTVAIGGPEAATGASATNGGQNTPATIAVTVTLADQSALGTLDQAPVAVHIVSATAEHVLTVPVAALVALAEGGYGLEVVTGSTSRYVAVQTGMFADGRVQVAGNGIAEGTIVGVPS